jgi:hypothetical protein
VFSGRYDLNLLCSYSFLPADALIRFQARPCKICGGKSGTETGSSPSFPCQCHSIIFIHTLLLPGQMGKAWEPSKKQSSLGSREALDRQVDSIQPEGTAIGQFDQYCQWFPSVLKKILSWYTKFTLHCMVLMQPSPELSSKISPKCSTGDKSFIIISPSKHKIQPKYSDSSL